MNLTKWNRYLYGAWAPFYDLLVGSLEEKRKLSLELAAVKPGEKVLLLGAGTGLDLEYLPKDAEITAIDITPEMITRLRKRASRLGMNVDARVMDGQQLDFADNSFDVVIMHFVLAVIPEPRRTIQETRRVMRPDGRAIILNKFLKDDSNPSPFLRLANKVARLLITDITCKLKPLLAGSGLTPVYQETVGFGGFFKIAILTKESAQDADVHEQPGTCQSGSSAETAELPQSSITSVPAVASLSPAPTEPATA